MSRAVIYDAIAGYAPLNAVGIDEDSVFASWTKKTRPRDDGPFIILRWYETPMQQGFEGPRVLEVWAHWPEELSTDYVRIDNILKLVDDAILPLEQILGDDGYILTKVEYSGKSQDLVDRAYNTITRNASYGVLNHLAP